MPSNIYLMSLYRKEEQRLLKSSFKLKSWPFFLISIISQKILIRLVSLHVKQFTCAHFKMDFLPTPVMTMEQNMALQNQPANRNSRIWVYANAISSNFVSVFFPERVQLICQLFPFNSLFHKWKLDPECHTSFGSKKFYTHFAAVLPIL